MLKLSWVGEAPVAASLPFLRPQVGFLSGAPKSTSLYLLKIIAYLYRNG